MPDMDLDALIDKINETSAKAASEPPEAKDFKDAVDNSGSAQTIEYIKSKTISMQQSRTEYNPGFGPTRRESGFGKTTTTTTTSTFGSTSPFGSGTTYGGYSTYSTQKPQISLNEKLTKFTQETSREVWEKLVDNNEQNEPTTSIFNIFNDDNKVDKRKAQKTAETYSSVNKLMKMMFTETRRQLRKEVK